MCEYICGPVDLLIPQGVKRMVFYAARDDMTKVICGIVENLSPQETRELLEQNEYLLVFLAIAPKLRTAVSLLLGLTGTHASSPVNNMCEYICGPVDLLIPQGVKRMVFYAARDDMTKVICGIVENLSPQETRELLEQNEYLLVFLAIAPKLRTAVSLLLGLTGTHASSPVNNMCEYICGPVDLLIPQGVKRMVFYAARDDMTKVICGIVENLSPQETRELLEQEVMDKSGQNLTPLIVASNNGHITVVKVLINKYHVNVEQEGCVKIENFYIEGATALWCAAGAGHLSVVKALVNAGADVNHTTANNSTPIRAACYDGRLDIVKYLAMHGADINKPNRYNNTCLMIASYKGHKEIVRFLLHNKVDPNQQAHCGATALFFAAECGHLDVVSELIDNGAAIIPTATGVTPMMAAAERTRSAVVEYFDQVLDLPPIDKINMYELLGASFANDKDNYNLPRAYYYLQRAMGIRYLESEPILKNLEPPILAYDNWVECQTPDELYAIRHNENSLHMEALAIRERLLGCDNSEVLHPIIYRGAVFADIGRFDRCITLWIHALELAINCKESLVKDLRRFAQIFSQMVHDGIELQFHLVAYILEIAVMELEKNKTKYVTAAVKDDMFQAKDDIENDVITALYLIVIISKLMDDQDVNDVYFIYQLVFRLNQLKVTARGLSLLHLCVSADTPVDNFHTSNICRFPCATTAKLLIKCGADVNSLDDERNSPLHTIVNYHKPLRDFSTLHTIMRDLVDAGAHIDIVNSRGKTPLEAAASGVAEIILQSMSKPSLQCMAARVVAKTVDDFDEKIPQHLVNFVKLHAEIVQVTVFRK